MSYSSPVAASLSEVCIVQRSAGMEDLERRLQLAVVVYVGGARPPVSCEEATVMLAAQLDIPRHRFSVHKFFPEDFLVAFASHEFRNKALAQPVVLHQGVQLHIKPWLRRAQATARCMRVQADILIEGVPSHTWTKETAAELLGSSCLIDSLAPETKNRKDLSLFKLRAWCVDPDEVPVSRRLWVLEPVAADPAERRPSFRQLLEYPTLIHIGRPRDFLPPDMWRRISNADSDSGQSGLPDSSHGSFAGGDWTVQSWSRGVRDRRGSDRYGAAPATGGDGRSYRQALEGRVGPSDWRLPPMTSPGRMGPHQQVPNRVVVSDPGWTPNGPQSRLVVPAVLVEQATEKMATGQLELVKSGALGASDDSDKAKEDGSGEVEEGVGEGRATQDPAQLILSPRDPEVGDSADAHADGWAPITELSGSPMTGLVSLGSAPRLIRWIHART
ncbi:unnamed protein product [Triticum aestivum]|uniref:Uncharacterized protein n=1 Tax=Triticum aestivum TaxID=4565 RepID=A0A7H4LD99_WHEAT|nr:unnamed protein product [Triticum aestivum]